MIIDRYWNETLQAITEDENNRIRKRDMIELERSDIVEVVSSIGIFEKRLEERLQQLKKVKHENKP